MVRRKRNLVLVLILFLALSLVGCEKRQEVQIPSNEEISEVNLLNESKLDRKSVV